MPQVYRRRAEFVVAEPAAPGGTVSTRDGITPVRQGDMTLHVGGEQQLVSAADFAQQFEAVTYEDAPEHLREIVDPERVQREREEATEKAERDARREERRPSGSSGGGGRSGKTTKTKTNRGRSSEAHERGRSDEAHERGRSAEAHERRRNDEAHRQHEADPAETARAAAAAQLQDEGDFGPQPTEEAQIQHGA